MQNGHSLQAMCHVLLTGILGGILISGCSAFSGQPSTSNTGTSEDENATLRTTTRTDVGTGNQYPGIVPHPGKSGRVRAKFRFPFEENTVRLELKISKSVLAGAKRANKFAVSVAGKEDRNWREKYNLAFIDDPAQAPILDELHQKLLHIAKSKKLDRDRTVELFTAFVQHIEYDDSKSDEARFPIETLADEKGDCDDKSRLLVALLMRSGFNVSTLHFGAENHMAVGIKSNGLEFKNTGYSYIETTTPSLIGFPFAENADVQLHTMPSVQRIGTGKARYTASKDVKFIVQTLRSLELEIKNEQVALNKQNEKCLDASHELKELQREMDNSTNSAASHPKAVSRFNKAVDTYNKAVKKQQKLASTLNRRIDLRNFIVNNAMQRLPTVTVIKNRLKTID